MADKRTSRTEQPNPPDANKTRVTTRSALKFMFMPEFDKSFRQVNTDFSVLKQAVLGVFFMLKFISREQFIALDASDLGFFQTMREINRNLSGHQLWISRGIIGFLVLSLVIFAFIFLSTILVALSGSAQAAGSGDGSGSFGSIFKVDETKDLAAQIINYIFLDGSLSGLPTNSVLQQGIKSAMAFFANGILVVGSFLLLYHLIFMIAETAHTGKPMGEADQIWAPLRLVFAIGLLVPAGSSNLNLGQHLVIEVTKMGSALGSNVWEAFAKGIAVNKANGEMTGPDYDPSPEIIAMLKIRTCLHYINSFYEIANPQGFNFNDYTIQSPGLRPADKGSSIDGDQIISHGKSISLGKDAICGQFIGGLATGKLGSTAQEELKAKKNIVFHESNEVIYKAVADQYKKIDELSKKVAQAAVSASTSGGSVPMPDASEANSIIDAARNAVGNKLTEVAKKYNAQIKTDISANVIEGGWLKAGQYYLYFTKLQSQLKAPQNLDFKIKEPDYAALSGVSPEAGMLAYVVGNGAAKTSYLATPYMNFAASMMNADADAKNTLGGFFSNVSKGTVSDKYSNIKLPQNYDSTKREDKESLGRGVFVRVAEAIGFTRFSNVRFNSFDPGINDAFTQLVVMGHEKLTISKSLFAAAAVAAFINYGVSSVLMFLGQFMLIPAILLAFMLPLLPFFKFTFSSLSWIISFVEAVVAAPLWALAHINPKGKGLSGDSGKRGYFLLFELFLRPALMVIGFVFAIIVFNVMVWLASKGFDNTFLQTGKGADPIDSIILSFIYGFFIYSLANMSMKLIDWIPTHAVKWGGIEGNHSASDDPNLVQGAAQGIGGSIIASNQLLGGLPQKSTSGLLADRRHKSEQIDNAREDRRLQTEQNQLLRGLGGNNAPPDGGGGSTARDRLSDQRNKGPNRPK